ncbi:class I SAM-dependent methyltransferase [Desulforamulus aeronauticus]|uniref:Methyltransferase domain-containing protein n=1 Tax=Desulforamulus aeronauticus DSM 10349 TaxID=1121421 RepID=A0A1M6UYR1_9FIRM|nr:class I SAM-dependent methyltransferase [Desulforamulus aeronauticus]SHK74186.1 Methyltransferase domain-containing protein [Desulforamulus aeronauticus DSM 10349]
MERSAITMKAYNKSAKGFENKFMNLDLYKEKLGSFCRLLKSGSKILDLGCGPGNVAKYLFESNQGFTVVGIDLSEEMIKLARQNVPHDSVMFKVGDIRELEMEENKYDAVVASFCIVHLDNDETINLLKKVVQMLKKNGMLYLSCMEGKKSGFETTSFSNGGYIYFNYYSEEFLGQILQESGLKILQLLRQDYPEEDGSITTDMFLFACKV